MARSFNGTSDLISMGTPNLVPSGNAWSASAWVNIVTISANTVDGFAFIFGDRQTGAAYEIFLYFTNGYNTPPYGFGAYNGTNFTSFTSGGAIAPNTWYHVLAACDSTSFIAYLNGVNIGTDVKDYSAGSPSVRAVTIGQNKANNVEWFQGSIADLALWNNVKLTATEAAALSKGARPYQIRTSALVGWWPLDGLQSPEPDLSGKKNNGTLTGTALAAQGPPMVPFTPRWPQSGPLPVYFTIRKQVRLNILQTGP